MIKKSDIYPTDADKEASRADYWEMEARSQERGKEQWKASAKFEAVRSQNRAEWIFELQTENAELKGERDHYRGRMNEQADRVKELEAGAAGYAEMVRSQWGLIRGLERELDLRTKERNSYAEQVEIARRDRNSWKAKTHQARDRMEELEQEVESLRGKDNTPIKEGDRVRVEGESSPRHGITGTVQWIYADFRPDGYALTTPIDLRDLRKI